MMERRQHVAGSDPHAGGPLVWAGPPPEDAAATLILVHGRGGTAQSMLSLFDVLAVDRVSTVAPQAAGGTWYPQSFMAPLEANQPSLDSALRRISSVVRELMGRGIPSEGIALLGFSQGACLTLEFVARNPRRYGAVMALTGGLIGPPGTPRNYPGSPAGTPVFLGSSDPDPHVPFERVLETRDVLERMGAKVEVRRYAGMAHTINEDEMNACREMLGNLVSRREKART